MEAPAERKIKPSEMRAGMMALGMSAKDVADWEHYHSRNQNIWFQLELLFLMRITAGAKRIGVKKLFEDLRHNPELKKEWGEEFKLENGRTSEYARALATKWPEFKHLIEIRNLTRKK